MQWEREVDDGWKASREETEADDEREKQTERKTERIDGDRQRTRERARQRESEREKASRLNGMFIENLLKYSSCVMSAVFGWLYFEMARVMCRRQ